jgi:hypothetical protein
MAKIEIDEEFFANSHHTRDQRHTDQQFDFAQHKSGELKVQLNTSEAHLFER